MARGHTPFLTPVNLLAVVDRRRVDRDLGMTIGDLVTETTRIHLGGWRNRLTAAIAVSLLIAPALAGCSVNPIESAIEGVTGGNIDLSGTTIPDDFPSEVPLLGGEVVNAMAAGTAPEKIWTVTMKVTDASVLEGVKADMEAAGFTSELGEAAVGDITGGMYTSETYSVLIVVAEEKDSGWMATYTVGPAAQ